MTNDTEPAADASELRLLEGLRRHHATPPPEAVDRMRHAVLHATTNRPVTGDRGPRVSYRRGMLAGVLAAAVTIGGSVAVAVSHRPGERAPVVSGGRTGAPAIDDHAPAQLVLAAAARRIQAEPPFGPRAEQYLYRLTVERARASYSVGDKTVKVYEEQRNQTWLDARHGLRTVRIVRTTGLNRTPVTPEDAAVAARVGFDLHAAPRTQDSDKPVKGGPGLSTSPTQPPSLRYPTPGYLAGLTTDPTRLLALLHEAAAAEGTTTWPTDKIAFRIAGDLFEQGDPLLPPALRTGLLRALALMPGVERVEGQTDFAGRRGIAVGFAEGGEREDILLDPDTLHPIGDRLVRLTATKDSPAGVESWSTFTFAMVDHPGMTG